ncbi:MAG: sugar ABC transporter ATP-binding protein [Kiritimatiellia bacterium]|jgi:ribose transport system ATP-binding protein|nr:sugar ABC transporter ATP-binding protein [Kiritimatiellia bacterium]MDP6847840.1 sugar ABC transporter ATP-binding protein [Kiritimatiellia bacterium]
MSNAENTTAPADVIVEMRDICKTYPGVQALKNASLTVRKGEVKALMGENGAGKSTLIKMLTGAETLTSGEICIHGERVPRMTPAISEGLGISCVYQHMMLAEHLSVAENVWLGKFPSCAGFVNKAELVRKTVKVLDDIGYGGVIDPTERVANLTASQQGMVAIVKAICRDAKIVIFDEPTAVLADREAEELFRVINLLREQHLAIIYISHRMEEIFKVCDTVTVLKDGQYAGDAVTKDIDEDGIISMMVGRELSASHYDDTRRIGEELFRAENVTNNRVKDCSLSVKSGEIVGIYGLVGAGRTELSRAIFGSDPVKNGTFTVKGKNARISSPKSAIDLGMSLIPEDRRRQGLALQLSVRHNINLAVYRRNDVLGFIRTSREKETSRKFVESLAIKTPTDDQKVKNLSGGNQQKVVVGKWLASEAEIFIMDEPTNGIDVGAKEEIYALINKLAHQGSAIICVSSYMPEVMDICDRIIVMNSGEIVANVDRADFDEEDLLSLAIKTRED